MGQRCNAKQAQKLEELEVKCGIHSGNKVRPMGVAVLAVEGGQGKARLLQHTSEAPGRAGDLTVPFFLKGPLLVTKLFE